MESGWNLDGRRPATAPQPAAMRAAAWVVAWARAAGRQRRKFPSRWTKGEDGEPSRIELMIELMSLHPGSLAQIPTAWIPGSDPYSQDLWLGSLLPGSLAGIHEASHVIARNLM